MVKLVYRGGLRSVQVAYRLELSSNIVIRPMPRVKMANGIHIMGRYRPVRETTIPAMAEKTAQPNEKGSILHKLV